MFKTVALPKAGASVRFSVLQLNTLGRFDEPVPVVVQRSASLRQYALAARPAIAAFEEVPDAATSLGGQPFFVDELVAAHPSYARLELAKPSERGDRTVLLVDRRYFSVVGHRRVSFGGGASQFALVAVLAVASHSKNGSTSPSSSIGGDLVVVVQHAKAGRTEENEQTRIDQSKAVIDFLVAGAGGQAEDEIFGSLEAVAPLVASGRLLWLGDFNAGPHSYNGRYPARWYPSVVLGVQPPPAAAKGDGAQPWVNTAVPLYSVMRAASGATGGGVSDDSNNISGEEPPYTTYKYRKGDLISQTIDYILVSRGSKALSIVAAVPPTLDDASQLPKDGFPCDQWGSDHLPLLCELEIIPNTM